MIHKSIVLGRKDIGKMREFIISFYKNNITNEKAHYLCTRFNNTAMSISVKFTYSKKRNSFLN